MITTDGKAAAAIIAAEAEELRERADRLRELLTVNVNQFDILAIELHDVGRRFETLDRRTAGDDKVERAVEKLVEARRAIDDCRRAVKAAVKLAERADSKCACGRKLGHTTPCFFTTPSDGGRR